MLVPEQRQGNWRGFVILTAINHSPALNWLTRTFLPALSLSRLEKQMVAILPLHLQRCIMNYMGCVLLRVCGGKPGLLSFQILQEWARIQITLSVKGKKNIQCLLQFGKCERGMGTWASTVIFLLGLYHQEYCFHRSFNRNNLFQHFIWLRVPLELAGVWLLTS